MRAAQNERSLVPSKQTGRNRLCVHLLAEAAGSSYADMKLRLNHIAMGMLPLLSPITDLIGRRRNACGGLVRAAGLEPARHEATRF